MNVDKVARELVKSLRGKRSQLALSRRLGYCVNVVYNWEKGRRYPGTQAFLMLARRVGVEVDPKLSAFLGEGQRARVNDSLSDTARLLSELAGERTLVDLARAVGADRSTVARWLAGSTEPRLPELLRWVQATTQRLLDFVAIFVDPATLSSTRSTYRVLLAQRELAYQHPQTHAVLRALEIDDYRQLPQHQPGFIAKAVGIGLEEEAACLRQLVAAGQIRRQKGRYVVRRVLTVDTRQIPEKNRALKRYWANQGLCRLEHAKEGRSLFSYNLFAVTQESFEQIRREHIEFFERVRTIVAASRGAERVVLLNQQLIALEE